MQNNKFIALLEEQAIKNTIRSELSNLLYKIRETGKINDFVEIKQIDDFFKLYIDDLKKSPEDIYNVLYKNKYERTDFYELLFGDSTLFSKNREENVKIFYSLFNKDKEIFLNAFKELINVNLSMTKIYSELDSFNQEVKDRELKIVNDMIDIGLNNNYFKNQPKEFFYTKNEIFNELFLTREILQKNYSTQILISNLSKKDISSFLTTYQDEILDDVLNNKEFIKTIQKSERLDLFLSQFCNFYESSNGEEKTINAVKVLFSNIEVTEQILSMESSYANWFAKFSTLLPFYLKEREKCYTKQENNEFYKIKDINEYDYSHKRLYKVLNKFKEYKCNEISKDGLDFIFNKWKENNNDKNLVDCHIGKFLCIYLVQNFDKNKESAIEIINKYKDKISKVLVLNENTSFFKNENVKNFYDLLNKLKEHGFKELENEMDKITIEATAIKVKEIVQKEINRKSNHVYDGEFKKELQNLLLIVNDNRNVLDLLNDNSENPLWSQFKINMLEKDKKSSFEDYPFAFYVINKTNGKASAYFAQPDKIEIFKDIEFNGKGYVANFKGQPWFYAQLEFMIENGQAFKKIVMEDKKSLTILKKELLKTANEKISTAINFYELNAKIKEKNKTEEVQPKRMKM